MTPEKRLDICKECEFYRQSMSQCKKCMCIMKIKVHFKNAKCPMEKW